MNIIVFDTETTGLLNKSTGDLVAQPHICQFAAITLECDPAVAEKGLVPIRETDKLIRPPVAIPESATAVNGITNEMVAGAPTFPEVVDELMSEFRAATIAVAHNIEFDQGVIETELERLGRPRDFLPPRIFDTMTETRDLCRLPSKKEPGFKRPKLQELHKHLFGSEFPDAHSAIGDVRATVKCLQELYRVGIFRI